MYSEEPRKQRHSVSIEKLTGIIRKWVIVADLVHIHSEKHSMNIVNNEITYRLVFLESYAGFAFCNIVWVVSFWNPG